MQCLGSDFDEQQPGNVGIIWKAHKGLDTTIQMWGVVTSSGGRADAVQL